MDERDADGAGIAMAAMAGELRALIGRLNRRLREEARPGDFTPSQSSALGRLVESDLTLTSLARAEGMRPQSMRAIVAVLEAAGLVVGAPDPSDGRQVILSLSAEARETIEANRVAKEDWLFRTIRAKLSAGEQEQLAGSIELMKRLLDP